MQPKLDADRLAAHLISLLFARREAMRSASKDEDSLAAILMLLLLKRTADHGELRIAWPPDSGEAFLDAWRRLEVARPVLQDTLSLLGWDPRDWTKDGARLRSAWSAIGDP